VIPLYGDCDYTRPKVPSIPWAIYQQYPASLNEHQQWINFGGLGIVTGHVSHLVVLDFDSETVFNTFKVQYPDLLDTHTVQSAGRKLPHLYFKLPNHLHIDSQKGQGIDILSNGRYVVAPPTSIAGQSYAITRGGMPKTLTERDIRRIQTFIKTHTTQKPSVSSNQPIASKTVKATQTDLKSIYHHLCKKGGRNEALFHTSLFARDTGWQQSETQTYLSELHSHQLTKNPHNNETIKQRFQEAQRTIKSAFSRPLRRNRTTRQSTNNQLPNSVREALMQRKMTYVIRTLEGLFLEGMRPGQVVSTQQAEFKLKGLVGRDSIHNALQAIGEGGQPFFQRLSPVNPHKTAKAVASSKSRLNNKKCFLLPPKSQEKIGKGRPTHHYQIPRINDLCHLLGVRPSNSDPLEQSDLRTAHQTRMTLHRELIKRRPGKYSRRWLAKRLGVTITTIDNYNHRIPIHSRSTYMETTIRWNTIERLPLDEPLKGAFLVTITGKKYPALRTIASRLLAKGEGVCLKEQGGNIYWYGNTEPDVNLVADIQANQIQKQQAIEVFLAPKSQSSEQFWRKTKSQKQPVPNQRRLHNNFDRPFSDAKQEALAQHVYTTINNLGQKTISIRNARRIVLAQSENQVQKALNLIQQRTAVINPVGFLITILQSKVHI